MQLKCRNVDKVKPLDTLIDDKFNEFESGEDRSCDRELDKLIWELGDFENEESPQEAAEFEEEVPIEEELVEGKLVSRKGRKPPFPENSAFREVRSTGSPLTAGVELATAHSLSPEPSRKTGRKSPAGPSRAKGRKKG
jgi:hypothetical protein